jgi:DNA-directed RNA polymerase subunit beta'
VSDGVERAVHRLQYGAKLRVDEGDKIKRGQRIAEAMPVDSSVVSVMDWPSTRSS